MRRMPLLVVLAAVPLLTGALWMDEQPSHKPYETPAPATPATSVPISGRETVRPEDEPRNPVTPSQESVTRGKVLFDINCAMCHGRSSAERGRVGRKLTPPAPVLEPDLVRTRSDAHIFKAVTFGFGRMPPFRDKLSSPERWDVVNYLRTRK